MISYFISSKKCSVISNYQIEKTTIHLNSVSHLKNKTGLLLKHENNKYYTEEFFNKFMERIETLIKPNAEKYLL